MLTQLTRCQCFFKLHTHLILRGAEQIVPSSMQGQSSDPCLVGTHHLDTVAPGDGPHTDGAVWRCREDHSLEGQRQKGWKRWPNKLTERAQTGLAYCTKLWQLRCLKQTIPGMDGKWQRWPSWCDPSALPLSALRSCQTPQHSYQLHLRNTRRSTRNVSH